MQQALGADGRRVVLRPALVAGAEPATAAGVIRPRSAERILRAAEVAGAVQTNLLDQTETSARPTVRSVHEDGHLLARNVLALEAPRPALQAPRLPPERPRRMRRRHRRRWKVPRALRDHGVRAPGVLRGARRRQALLGEVGNSAESPPGDYAGGCVGASHRSGACAGEEAPLARGPEGEGLASGLRSAELLAPPGIECKAALVPRLELVAFPNAVIGRLRNVNLAG
mmetsp:Transcript_55404/g.160883  ORF Transcript_55404/g.160883 Transcript_55404/m.160883 type:complete len:227 (+) Transcript_55404:633-1313(+)